MNRGRKISCQLRKVNQAQDSRESSEEGTSNTVKESYQLLRRNKDWEE